MTTVRTQTPFAELLRRQRTAAGLTQEALAGRCGLGVRTLRELERGAVRRPQRETVARLAEGLDLAPEAHAAFAAAARASAHLATPLPTHSLRLLTLSGGAQDLPERQRTLRGVVAWSFDLLVRRPHRKLPASWVVGAEVGGAGTSAPPPEVSMRLEGASPMSTTHTDLVSRPRELQTPLAALLRLVGLPGMAPRRRLAPASRSSPATRATGRSERVEGTDEATRNFILRIVQPGLAGLMDGSVSTLAPLFATAFVTHSAFKAFLVGMAAATGAGISMAFAEALSDTGEWTGRGKPWLRGGVIGSMTFCGGSLHTLPFLLPTLQVALLAAYLVVASELVVIAMIRRRFFGTNWGLSILQVVGSGVLVFAAALLFGHG